MKKRILAGFILLTIPAFIFAHNTHFSFFQKNSQAGLITSDTIPLVENLPQQQTDYSTKAEKSTSSKSNSKADKLFNNMSYLSSADYFLKMDAEGKLSVEDKEKLADSYRLNGMTEDAEHWYAQVVNYDVSQKAPLHYAQMLQSNGKCEDAARWFKIYSENANDKNRTFIENCDELNKIPEITGASVENIESLNTSSLDFSPIKYKNGIVFSSTRGTARSTKNIDKWTKENFSDLFFAKKSDDQFSNINPLDGANDKFHDGTATFNRNGDYMIFTRNSTKEKSRKGVRELKLFEATLEEDRWTNIQSLNINDNDFPTCHPTLSKDGQRLYFSSDRPGGYGGMDIYMSKKIGSQWATPKNLGPIVNSSGNELFPYIHDDEKLYFSSNGHKGVGGLDIFVVEKSNHSEETSWNIRKNIGKPFNSPKDDVGFTIEKNNQSGYLASNRAGGMGKDDIYAWTMNGKTTTQVEEIQIEKTFCAYNIMNNERIEGVDVSIISGDFQADHATPNLTLLPSKHKKNEYILAIQKENKTYTPNAITQSDANGKFNHAMENGLDYFFVLSKKGFATVQHRTDFPTVKKRKEYCIAMAPQSCMTMKGSVINKEYNQPVPFAEIEMFDRGTGESIMTQTNQKGEFETCVRCNSEFEIMARKNRFKKSIITFSTLESDCREEKLEPAIISLVLNDRTNWNDATMGINYSENQPQYNNQRNSPQQHPFNNSYVNGQAYGSSPNGNSAPVTKEFLVEYFTGNPNTVITAGHKFTLKNIYYDFDKSNIRSDAKIELDYIANLMQMQPTMEISLISHTDSRGNIEYNQTLSSQRATAAKSYLISKGISPNRIHNVEGMGERQPVVPCFNGDCSDSDHQTNRRTEIIIDKI